MLMTHRVSFLLIFLSLVLCTGMTAVTVHDTFKVIGDDPIIMHDGQKHQVNYDQSAPHDLPQLPRGL